MEKDKEVKKSTKKLSFYLTILNLLKEGKNLKEISVNLSISKQKLCYYTTILKQLGFIEKKGYGTWEVKRSKDFQLEHAIQWREKKIRGHAFIWTVKLNKKFDWIEILRQKSIPYKLVRGYTPRIFLKDKKVWLGKKTLTVYDNKSFYGKNAVESRKYAVFALLEVLRELSKKLGVRIGKPYFKPTREHYGLIKNELARQCNDKGEKIIVRDDLDGEWLWIDDSESLGELETGGKGITKDRVGLNLEVQRWWNDNKTHDFKVTPTFLLETINQVTQNQAMFAKNIEEHMTVLKDMRETMKDIRENLKK